MAVSQQNTGDGLILRLRPWTNWLGVLTAMAILLIVTGVGLEPAVAGLRLAIDDGNSVGGFILGIVACIAIDLFFSCGLLVSFFGSETVTVTSTDLEI